MEAEPVAATVAGASPPARRSPRNGLPPSWSADEVYAHARAEWNNTDNALKEVPPSSWPWTMWANELHKSYAKKDGVAEAELQNLDTGKGWATQQSGGVLQARATSQPLHMRPHEPQR